MALNVIDPRVDRLYFTEAACHDEAMEESLPFAFSFAGELGGQESRRGHEENGIAHDIEEVEDKTQHILPSIIRTKTHSTGGRARRHNANTIQKDNAKAQVATRVKGERR